MSHEVSKSATYQFCTIGFSEMLKVKRLRKDKAFFNKNLHSINIKNKIQGYPICLIFDDFSLSISLSGNFSEYYSEFRSDYYNYTPGSTNF